MGKTVDLLELAPAAGIHLPRYQHTAPENESELTKRMRSLYDPEVPHQVPVTDELLIDMLRTQSNHYPRRVALDFLGAKTSYQKLADNVQRTAAFLKDNGVARGDRVSIIAPNCPQFVYIMYACLQLGAVCVLHNPLATPVELRWQIENVESKVVFAWQKAAYDTQAITQALGAKLFVINMAKAMPKVLRLALRLPIKSARKRREQMSDTRAAGFAEYDELFGKYQPERRITRVDPDIPAMMLHTGGTTGKPKAVILTNRNLVSNLKANAAWVTKLTEGKETWYCILPFFHAFGLTLSLNGCLALAGTAVLFPKFDVPAVLASQKRRPGTFIVGVPPIFDRLAKAAAEKNVDLTTFNYAISGAMPLTKEVATNWEKATNGYIIEGYGMTETSPTVLGSPMGPQRKLGYMGIVFPSIQVRVVDPETYVDVEPGEIGELVVKGPGCAPGYWRDQVETDDLFTPDGWMKTGDLVEENDGFLKMSDRRKELILTSGFNVYPSEVEEAIVSMPQVQEVAVVGIPDQKDSARGEQVHAAIVLKPGASLDLEKVRSWAEESLPRYALPRSLSFPQELDKNQLGKIQRRRVREKVLQQLHEGYKV